MGNWEGGPQEDIYSLFYDVVLEKKNAENFLDTEKKNILAPQIEFVIPYTGSNWNTLQVCSKREGDNMGDNHCLWGNTGCIKMK